MLSIFFIRPNLYAIIATQVRAKWEPTTRKIVQAIWLASERHLVESHQQRPEQIGAKEAHGVKAAGDQQHHAAKSSRRFTGLGVIGRARFRLSLQRWSNSIDIHEIRRD